MKYFVLLLAVLGVMIFVVTCWVTWWICWYSGVADPNGLALGFWVCGSITACIAFISAAFISVEDKR